MGIFDKIFSKKNATKAGMALVKEPVCSFSVWSGDAYQNDIFRGAVDAIARNAAKIKGSHVVNYENCRKPLGNCVVNRLLQSRPNPYMTAYDYYYKTVTHLYTRNNAFSYIDRDYKGDCVGIYPIDSLNAEMLSDEHGRLYTKFTLNTGNTVTFSYNDVIHLRRFYNGDMLFGSDNSALFPALELAHTANEGIVNGIKAGANLRGMLKYTTIIAPEKLEEEKRAFMESFLDMSNDGGIVVTDSKSEFIPLDSKPVLLDEKQTAAISEKIYTYLGVSKTIVTSNYTEDEYSAFAESVLEPLCVAMSQEFTNKLFSERQRAFGNEVVFESGRLQFTSNKTKVELLRELLPLGLLSQNDAREILNLSPVPDGDKRIMSLNYIDADTATEYQLGKVNKNTKNIENTKNTEDMENTE